MKNKSLTPQIRFNGFEDEWQQALMDDITTSYSGGTPRAGVKEYYGGNIPFIRSGEIHGDKTELFITQKGFDESSAAMVEKGSILYALYGATSGEVDICKIQGAINQAILSITPNVGHNAEYLNYWLFVHKKQIVQTYLQGGQGNLSGAIVKNFTVDVPLETEQREIGTFFKQIDEMIAEAEREVSRLEKMKQASLQKMFPRPGATAPEIRFDGFIEPWQSSSFSDIFAPLKNNTFSRACLNYESGTIKNIHYGDVLIKFDSVVDVNNAMVPYINNDIDIELNPFNTLSNGDIIFADTAEDEAVGKCVEIEDADVIIAVSGLHTIAVRPTMKFARYYLGYYLNSNSYHSQLLPLMQGIKVLSIGRYAMADTKILYPQSIDEQKAIGEYFRNLDSLLSAKRQKLVKLRNIKQACLDKMFVNTSDL